MSLPPSDTPEFDKVADLWRKASPDDWWHDNVIDGPDAYETLRAGPHDILADTLNSNAKVLEHGDDEGPAVWDQTGHDNFRFIVEAKNSMPAMKKEVGELRHQRDDLLMLLRRMIRAVDKGKFEPLVALAESSKNYIERRCPPERIIRAV